MRFILIIAILFSYTFAFSQQVDPELEEKELIMYFKGEDAPYSGPCVGYHENGTKGKEGQYINGRMEGVWTWWYSDGEKKRQGKYVQGKKDGKWMDWYKNGNPRAALSYSMGIMDGDCAWFYETGQKKKLSIFKDGVFMNKREWNEDGTEKAGGF